MTVGASKTLTAYQAEFVRQFRAAGSERHQWLAAPPLSGLTQCAQEIVSKLFAENPSARVLILSGRALVLRWMRWLEDVVTAARGMEGSRRHLREASEETSSFVWPEGHVVVMDSWSIERFPDLQASVFSTPWALVVWEGFRKPEFSERSGRVSLAERLANAHNVERLLLMSRVSRTTQGELELPGVKKIIWERSLIERSNERAQGASIEEITVTHEPSEGEITLRGRLEEFVAKWSPGSSRISPLNRLLSAAESSPPALQEYLQRLRPSKLAIVLPQLDLLGEADLPESNGSPIGSTKLESQASELTEEVSGIQDLLDGLSVDSKLETLLLFLRSKSDPRSRTLIECRFAATAKYLRSALVELPQEVFLITAELSATETLRILSAFEEHGSTLIATVSALQGVEFSADAVIVYESMAPWMGSAFRPRLRATEPGRPIQIIYLADASRKGVEPRLSEEA